MKTAEEIYIENGCNSKREIIESMKEYAIEVAREALKNASDSAKIFKSGNSGSYFDASINKESILSETNIPKLD